MPLIGPLIKPTIRVDLKRFSTWSIQRKLLTALLPSLCLLLLATGMVTNWFSSQYLHTALERATRLQVMAMAHAMEEVLAEAREDVLLLAEEEPSQAGLARFLESRQRLRGDAYREAVYVGSDQVENLAVVSDGERVIPLKPTELGLSRTSPLLLAGKLGSLEPGHVFLTDLHEIYHQLSSGNGSGSLTATVVRLATPVTSPDGTRRGLVMLSLDARRLRNVLSLYNSSQSPLYAFARAPERRYAYFMDKHGWILFQSENVEESGLDLSTQMARTGFNGDYGKPGFEPAFRPNPEHEAYWSMVVDLQSGRGGLINVDETFRPNESSAERNSIGYAPVRFKAAPASEPVTLGGVAYVDKSRLTMAAELRQIDVMFIITIVSIVLATGAIFLLSRAITRPILNLSAAMGEILDQGRLREIELPDQDLETSALKAAMNRLIKAILTQREELRLKDCVIEDARKRERVPVEELPPQPISCPLGLLDIVGQSPSTEELRTKIAKAAQVDADVLVIGETGTGKELTAQAIHRCGRRADKPFVSVNCGALDENLLLDALFGHVKGAFSEARSDRKGAFLTANGGTLFLDEIGNASHKVQQSLLRALAERKITPLGSDTEIDVDVRLIAATNADLRDAVQSGTFREDLYYRLKVILIRTPPLRDRKEDIPSLADYFLKEAATAMRKDGIALSRGAMERLAQHPWPGNIRELKNCITRAVAMAEDRIILVDDLKFDDAERRGGPAQPRSQAPAGPRSQAALNSRQRKAIPFLMQHGELSRSEYQEIIGAGVPLRTAQYDLHDMVKKGILRKSGKGPATRYHLARMPETVV